MLRSHRDTALRSHTPRNRHGVDRSVRRGQRPRRQTRRRGQRCIRQGPTTGHGVGIHANRRSGGCCCRCSCVGLRCRCFAIMRFDRRAVLLRVRLYMDRLRRTRPFRSSARTSTLLCQCGRREREEHGYHDAGDLFVHLRLQSEAAITVDTTRLGRRNSTRRCDSNMSRYCSSNNFARRRCTMRSHYQTSC
jgi:hypothetical protein